jgi:hypothetical protein
MGSGARGESDAELDDSCQLLEVGTRPRKLLRRRATPTSARSSPSGARSAAGNPTLLATIESNITADSEQRARRPRRRAGTGLRLDPAQGDAHHALQVQRGRGARALPGWRGALSSPGAFSQTDTRAASAGGTGKDYFTEGTLFTDAFVGYPFRLPWNKLSARVQLNGRNIFNSDLVSLARYNADFSGARRIYLREPRSWRLTLSVEY